MRVLFKAGATITDITKFVRGYKSDSYAMSYASGNAIYIGTDLPFNHFYLKLGDTVNAVAATTMSVANYKYNEFNASVEISDETNGLFKSGFVQFTPDRFEGWQSRATNDMHGTTITELSTVSIYDLFWTKITFNQTLTAAIDISWIGQKFSDDFDLFSEYPIFNDNMRLSAFELGKLDWEEQTATAAEIIVKDLQAKGIIWSKNQILERDVFKLASVSKTAQIIYNAFGKDYLDRALMAKQEYEARISHAINRVDSNANGVLDPQEKKMKTGWLSR